MVTGRLTDNQSIKNLAWCKIKLFSFSWIATSWINSSKKLTFAMIIPLTFSVVKSLSSAIVKSIVSCRFEVSVVCRGGYFSFWSYLMIVFMRFYVMRMLARENIWMIGWGASHSIIIRFWFSKNGRMVICGNVSFFHILNEKARTLAKNVCVFAISANHFYCQNKIIG